MVYLFDNNGYHDIVFWPVRRKTSVKSLGKQTIIFDNFYDGGPTLSISGEQTVYERKNGSLYITHMGGRKDIIFENGEYRARFDTRSVDAVPIQDIYNQIMKDAIRDGKGGDMSKFRKP